MKKRTKQIFISGIIGILLIGLATYLRYRLYGFVTYTDPKKRFTVDYPRQWEISKVTGGADVLFMSPQDGDIDLFRENVSVVVQPLGDNKPHNLADYSFKAVDQVRAVFGENVEVVENNPLVQLSGRAAHRFSFVGKGPEGRYKYLMLWTIDQRVQIAYQVTYAGVESQFDRYREEAEKMMQSFNITEAKQ